jgi:hypothetical protein
MPLYLGWWILLARNMRTFFWIVIKHAFRYRILYFTKKKNISLLDKHNFLQNRQAVKKSKKIRITHNKYIIHIKSVNTSHTGIINYM